MPVSNPFDSPEVARRYARGRPDYSRHVQRIAAALLRSIGATHPHRRALDVACGTGISTRALSALAEDIVAIDASPSMIELATPRKASYVIARAEQLPFAPASFDLIGVGSAIHWLDPEAFHSQLERVARPNAWLIIHGHRWSGRLAHDERFREWMVDRYLRRYPAPQRHRTFQPPGEYGVWGHCAWERFEHSIDLTLPEVIDYLTTQSNIVAALEKESEPDIRQWLRAELEPFFAERSAGSFTMDGYVALHRR